MSSESPLDKKVVRTSPVLWALGAILASFLGSLGSTALDDIADLFPMPLYDTFYDRYAKSLEIERQALEAAPNVLQEQMKRQQRDLEDQERVLATAEENFRTWLNTRATLGGTVAEDKEVRQRRDRLEALRKERDDIAEKLAKLRATDDPKTARLAEIDKTLGSARRSAQHDYDAALGVWRIKVLVARLALTLPILLFAYWLWARRRNSAYLTILWGYWAFSIWMLLYGIGPYLPDYGGYVPLAAGTALTIWGSIALVRYFNKRAPIRRQRIVDQAIAKHRCPGCGADYLVGRESSLELGVVRKTTRRQYDTAALRPHTCPACGLELFGACANCNYEQMVHLPYCAGCGSTFTAKNAKHS